MTTTTDLEQAYEVGADHARQAKSTGAEIEYHSGDIFGAYWEDLVLRMGAWVEGLRRPEISSIVRAYVEGWDSVVEG